MEHQSQADPRDKKSFKELTKRDNPAPVGIYHELLRAQPALESLTGNSDWDLYLSCCQFFLETAEKQKISVDVELSEGDVWASEKLVRLKAQSMCLGERIFTITQMMTLPKQIIADGEKVLEALKKQEKPQE